MKTIKRTYKIYRFNELTEKIQDVIINFNVQCECRNWLMGKGKMPTLKELIALKKYVKKEVVKLSYFKNGDIAFIK